MRIAWPVEGMMTWPNSCRAALARRLSRILGLTVVFLACGCEGSDDPVSLGSNPTATPTSSTTLSISQWGITWTFSEPVPYGKFANGDYWVVGPATITEIDPPFNGTNHGWQVNPVPGLDQGFDVGAQNFDAGLVPDLPYVAQPGSSIVKAISKFPGQTEECYPSVCLQTAAVLTVVDAVPPDGGATSFRPPYVGSAKPLYSTTRIRTDLLPTLAPVDAAPALDDVVARFQRVQIQHGFGLVGRVLRPEDNMDDYGPDNARDENDAILRLMLDDPVEDKMPALIAMIQHGIDSYHAVVEGQIWPAGGGHEPGHMLVLASAATLLDDEALKSTLASADFFTEYEGVYRSSVTSAPDGVLYGFPPGESREKDPNELVDAPAASALYCCLAMPWKGAVLATRLMPSLREHLDQEEWSQLAQFVDRWVSFGWWFPSPDADGLVTEEGERCVDLHNTRANEGSRGSAFQSNMWDTYR